MAAASLPTIIPLATGNSGWAQMTGLPSPLSLASSDATAFASAETARNSDECLL